MDVLIAFLAEALAYDFRILWAAGRAVVEGGSPYAVPGFFYPLNFAWFMAPFGLLPVGVAYVVLIGFSGIALRVLETPRRALLFAPVVYALFIGQVDLVLLALGLTGGWAGLALSTLKPQIGIWIVFYKFIQWYPQERRKIVLAAVAIAGLYLAPFAADPGWVADWFAASPGFLDYTVQSSSLFGIGLLVPVGWQTSTAAVALFGLGLLVVLLRSGRLHAIYWEFVALFNPLAHAYSLSIVYRAVDRTAVLLSWIALMLGFAVGTGVPLTVVPVYLILKKRNRARNSMGKELTFGLTMQFLAAWMIVYWCRVA